MKIEVKDYHDVYSTDCYWMGVRFGIDAVGGEEDKKLWAMRQWKKWHDELQHLTEIAER